MDPTAVVDNKCVLRRRGYTVNLVATGRAALQGCSSSDIVLLNMDLPDMDAFAVCTTIRARSDVPIIAIVNTDDEFDRVLALRSGADDCVQKSCGFHEVVARIDAIMARLPSRSGGAGHHAHRETLDHHGLTVDPSTRRANVHDRRLQLTEREFDLLAFLVSRHPEISSRKEIMKAVWHTEWSGASRTIDTHVSSLRAKLGSNQWITAVRGIGYRLGVPHTQSGEAVHPFGRPVGQRQQLA